MSNIIRLGHSGPPMPRRKSHLMSVRRSRAQDRAQENIRRIEAEKAARAAGKAEVVKPVVKTVSKPKPPTEMSPERLDRIARLNAAMAQIKAEKKQRGVL